MTAQPGGAPRRDERQCEEERGDHAERDREREGAEQKLPHTGMRASGISTMIVAERGDNGGQRDFVRAVESRLHRRFTHAHVTVDVFQHDDGVIDERPDGEGQSAEGMALIRNCPWPLTRRWRP